MLMYKLQSTEDSSTWLVVRIRSAEDGHSSMFSCIFTVVLHAQQFSTPNLYTRLLTQQC